MNNNYTYSESNYKEEFNLVKKNSKVIPWFILLLIVCVIIII